MASHISQDPRDERIRVRVLSARMGSGDESMKYKCVYFRAGDTEVLIIDSIEAPSPILHPSHDETPEVQDHSTPNGQ